MFLFFAKRKETNETKRNLKERKRPKKVYKISIMPLYPKGQMLVIRSHIKKVRQFCQEHNISHRLYSCLKIVRQKKKPVKRNYLTPIPSPYLT